MHHVAYEVGSFEDFARQADLLAANGVQVDWGPGRHAPSRNYFMYFDDADGNRIEWVNSIQQIPEDGTHVLAGLRPGGADDVERLGSAAAGTLRLMGRFEDRVAIVTGAGGAIGGAIAARLEAEGAQARARRPRARSTWKGALTVQGDLSRPGRPRTS